MSDSPVRVLEVAKSEREFVTDILREAIDRAEEYKCIDVLVVLIDKDKQSHHLFTKSLSMRERVGLIEMSKLDMCRVAYREDG